VTEDGQPPHRLTIGGGVQSVSQSVIPRIYVAGESKRGIVHDLELSLAYIALSLCMLIVVQISPII
jgi:hypothetical protein